MTELQWDYVNQQIIASLPLYRAEKRAMPPQMPYVAPSRLRRREADKAKRAAARELREKAWQEKLAFGKWVYGEVARAFEPMKPTKLTYAFIVQVTVALLRERGWQSSEIGKVVARVPDTLQKAFQVINEKRAADPLLDEKIKTLSSRLGIQEKAAENA